MHLKHQTMYVEEEGRSKFWHWQKADRTKTICWQRP